MHHENNAFLGIIGGSGLYKIFDDVEELDIDTPFGKPSSKIFLKNRRCLFIKARHKSLHTTSSCKL
jgi:methylthioadenosine phosphorylase (EC 2.4.2.28)